MLTSEDAERAMRVLPGIPIRGRPLKVKPCVQKRTGGSRVHSDHLESTRWKDRSREHSRQRQQHSPVMTSTTDLLLPVQESRRLYVGGLPKPIDNHASDLEIRDLFKDFDVEAVSKVKSPKWELLRGYGWYAFVDLTSAEEAARAIAQLNGLDMWGGYVTVKLANGSPNKVLETIATEEREHEEESEVGVLNYD